MSYKFDLGKIGKLFSKIILKLLNLKVYFTIKISLLYYLKSLRCSPFQNLFLFSFSNTRLCSLLQFFIVLLILFIIWEFPTKFYHYYCYYYYYIMIYLPRRIPIPKTAHIQGLSNTPYTFVISHSLFYLLNCLLFLHEHYPLFNLLSASQIFSQSISHAKLV